MSSSVLMERIKLLEEVGGDFQREKNESEWKRERQRDWAGWRGLTSYGKHVSPSAPQTRAKLINALLPVSLQNIKGLLQRWVWAPESRSDIVWFLSLVKLGLFSSLSSFVVFVIYCVNQAAFEVREAGTNPPQAVRGPFCRSAAVPGLEIPEGKHLPRSFSHTNIIYKTKLGH